MSWVLGKLFSGWKLVLGGLAFAAALFYRWRADRNAEKAVEAQNRVRYLEKKETQQIQAGQKMEAVAEKHKQEREKLQERRREGKRGGGLGKW